MGGGRTMPAVYRKCFLEAQTAVRKVGPPLAWPFFEGILCCWPRDVSAWDVGGLACKNGAARANSQGGTALEHCCKAAMVWPSVMVLPLSQGPTWLGEEMPGTVKTWKKNEKMHHCPSSSFKRKKISAQVLCRLNLTKISSCTLY